MVNQEYQPVGTSATAVELDDEPPPSDTVFVVTCSEQRYAFMEGSWAAFGRDDDACTIVIWECLRSNLLSRIAGVLWCTGGDLWVRNLSGSHELLVNTGTLPTHLTPRISGRGAACSLGDGGSIIAPSTGAWRLRVDRVGQVADEVQRTTDRATLTLVRPPEALMATAIAMCSPLLRRGNRPATYAEIARLTGAKNRTARDRVDRLVAFYREHGTDRLWRDFADEGSNYGPLARLLVYRSVVTAADLRRLERLSTSERVSAGG